MRVVAALLVLAGLGHAAERWRIEYFYDEDSSSLTLNDLWFASPRRGIAVGYLTERGKTRPAAVLTSDGGQNWSLVRTPEIGASLFFVNENLGWMVARNGLYRTEDSGRTWKRWKSPAGILRVHFQSESRGWAVGLRKGIFETSDGGQHWTRVAAGDEPKSDPEFTAYGWIAFANEKTGLIAGWSRPPRSDDRPRVPDWMDPARAQRRREWPSLTILLETRDGGKSWKPSVTSMFGTVSRICLAADGRGLGVIEFTNAFDWPSEVFRLNWRTGNSVRVFRRTDRAVTDAALLPNGPAYLAAVEPQGLRVRLPVPGKLRILRSESLAEWQEMEVDYRAFARRAMLAVADPGNVWVATDTGMILKLVSE